MNAVKPATTAICPSRGNTGGPSMGPTSLTRPARLRHTESVAA